MPDLSITEVFDASQDSIMTLPGVVGIGIGERGGEPSSSYRSHFG